MPQVFRSSLIYPYQVTRKISEWARNFPDDDPGYSGPCKLFKIKSTDSGFFGETVYQPICRGECPDGTPCIWTQQYFGRTDVPNRPTRVIGFCCEADLKKKGKKKVSKKKATKKKTTKKK